MRRRISPGLWLAMRGFITPPPDTEIAALCIRKARNDFGGLPLFFRWRGGDCSGASLVLKLGQNLSIDARQETVWPIDDKSQASTHMSSRGGRQADAAISVFGEEGGGVNAIRVFVYTMHNPREILHLRSE